MAVAMRYFKADDDTLAYRTLVDLDEPTAVVRVFKSTVDDLDEEVTGPEGADALLNAFTQRVIGTCTKGEYQTSLGNMLAAKIAALTA